MHTLNSQWAQGPVNKEASDGLNDFEKPRGLSVVFFHQQLNQ